MNLDDCHGWGLAGVPSQPKFADMDGVLFSPRLTVKLGKCVVIDTYVWASVIQLHFLV